MAQSASCFAMDDASTATVAGRNSRALFSGRTIWRDWMDGANPPATIAGSTHFGLTVPLLCGGVVAVLNSICMFLNSVCRATSMPSSCQFPSIPSVSNKEVYPIPYSPITFHLIP